MRCEVEVVEVGRDRSTLMSVLRCRRRQRWNRLVVPGEEKGEFGRWYAGRPPSK